MTCLHRDATNLGLLQSTVTPMHRHYSRQSPSSDNPIMMVPIQSHFASSTLVFSFLCELLYYRLRHFHEQLRTSYVPRQTLT